MARPGDEEKEALWSRHNEELRDPSEIVAQDHDSRSTDNRLLLYETQGKWWDTLADLGIAILVTREYEHLLLCMSASDSTGPVVSMMKMPHPSGIAVDRDRGIVHVACTRNPNQIYDLMPAQGLMPRLDTNASGLESKLLLPVRTRFLPGCLYIHDLAMVGGELHANSVGQNAVVKLDASGRHEKVWWPKCIETDDGPVFGRNHLQLNSIAAGENLEASFFSASTDQMTELRPGDPSFPVDGRGVIFSGASREPVARGLTRPHSARFHKGRVWVDNSGYGEVGFLDADTFVAVNRLPGWTRGLCFCKNVAFVGTSRVLSRFRQYAPGLELDSSMCGIHALDLLSGRVLGSIHWPFGSQIFGVEWFPADFASALPFRADAEADKEFERLLFYSFQVMNSQED